MPATPGNDLVLTIDKTLQYTTEQLLTEQVGYLGAAGGKAVVMDTATGDVLAMASVDRDQTTGQVSGVAGQPGRAPTTFEPGSVAKIVPSSAALDLGEATRRTGLARDGAVHKSDVYEIEDVEQHGNVDLTTTQIIAVSSNIGAVLHRPSASGPQNMEKYLRAFGFGAPSGLDLPNETGRHRSRPPATGAAARRDTINYGQGIAVTAMQLAAAMNTIANHGTYVAPRLVDATIDKARRPSRGGAVGHPCQVLSRRRRRPMYQILQQVWCVGTAGSAPAHRRLHRGRQDRHRLHRPGQQLPRGGRRR